MTNAHAPFNKTTDEPAESTGGKGVTQHTPLQEPVGYHPITPPNAPNPGRISDPLQPERRDRPRPNTTTHRPANTEAQANQQAITATLHDDRVHADETQNQTGCVHEYPDFMANIQYPHLTPDGDKRVLVAEGPAMGDLEEAPAYAEYIDQPTSTNEDRLKHWPFPHQEMRNDTALIYDAVRATNMHNHEKARIPLPTGLNINAWRKESTSHPDDPLIMGGIMYGFPIQYVGPPCYQADSHPNHSSASRYSDHVRTYIDHEVEEGALEGPFDRPPFTPWFKVSPLMSRAKADSDARRIIVDLSFPDGGLNAHIQSHTFNGTEATHTLPTIASAVSTIAKTCPGQIHMAVVDLSRAYRQFSVSPSDWPLLGITFESKYYFDRRIPFGAKMSSYVMQTVANFIVRALEKRGVATYMYLDDIVIISATHELALRHYQATLSLLQELGLAYANNKLQPPATTVKWLGIVFDLPRNQLSIPSQKLNKIKRSMAAVSQRKTITKKHLQSIIGLANHLAKIMRAARVFIGRLLAALRTAGNNTIQISNQVKADLRWFDKHATACNGRAIIPTERVVRRIWADACLTGAGASDGARYYIYTFTKDQTDQHHIARLEALNCLAAVRTFTTGPDAGGTIELFCDNRPSVDAFTSGRARDEVLAACSRALWSHAATHDVSIVFTHVPGEAMALPDALSRVNNSPSDRYKAERLIRQLRLAYTQVGHAEFKYSDYL